ncbi:MAG: hypothetical protein N4A47_01845 [Clostridia bacterium]|jgi:hypothetical protein|nr:hypothetical protein [Clostridia bacterium]
MNKMGICLIFVIILVITNVYTIFKAKELEEVVWALETKQIAAMLEDHEHDESCGHLHADERMHNQRVVDYSNGIIKFIESEKEDDYQTLTLVGYNTEFYDDQYKVVDYSGEKPANVKLRVFGTLYNLRLSNIKWDENYKTFKEFEEADNIFKIEEVTNTDVVFNSILAEGIPNEAIIWEDEDGNEFRYLLGYDGYGFANEVIICSEYDK